MPSPRMSSPTTTGVAASQRCRRIRAGSGCLILAGGRRGNALRAFADGLVPAEVADRLAITPKTVDTHKTAILAECRIAWNLPEDERLGYHWMREKFGRYFDSPGG